MNILHYVGFENHVEGGIKTSIDHQRSALDGKVNYTTDASEEYDILHLNTPDPASVFQLLKAKFHGKKTVFHAHVTGEDFKNSLKFSNLLAPLVGWYVRKLYGGSDLVIAPSEYTKELLTSKGVGSDIVVISNGIDTDRLDGKNQDKEVLKDKYSVDGFCAVNLGFVYERKGLSDFVDIGVELAEADFRWFGPHPNKLMASRSSQSKMENSPSNVKFPGFIDDIRDAFTLADVFLFPTREENQGISLLEAAYKEKPIIVRDIPTYEGWLEHRKHCLKAESIEEFVGYLKELENDSDLRERLSSNARKMAENHSLDQVGQKLSSAYEDLS